jgi:apolipoprotein D and lipocalin family protein
MINEWRYLIICLIFIGLFASCRGAVDYQMPELNVVSYVDLQRYKGIWYEIARYPNTFQKDCYKSRATYTLRDDGKITVLNECNRGSAKGKLKSAKGKAWVVDKKSNAKLKVSFFWPFSGDYWIIELDKNYQHVVIGHPKRKYLWILSREMTMEDALYDEILQRLRTEHKYDISKIMRTSEQ